MIINEVQGEALWGGDEKLVQTRMHVAKTGSYQRSGSIIGSAVAMAFSRKLFSGS